MFPRYRTVRVSRSEILNIPDAESGDFEALLRRVAAAWRVDEIVSTTFNGGDGFCDLYLCTFRRGRYYSEEALPAAGDQ
jgi:hypothetical protein